MNRAFIFPGQGSQIVGMGKDFFDNFPEAKSVFNIVDDTLGFKLSDLIFNGSLDELSLTTNTQPALMTVSIAITNTIIHQSKKEINELCAYSAGHSLGEYSALCASQAITLVDTTQLLRIRSHSMQNACPAGQGAMAACIGIETSKLQELIIEFKEEGVCEIANDNVKGQIVISGDNHNIDRMVAILKDIGFKAIKLNVSAPFHSSLIKAAVEPMTKALREVSISAPKVPLIANVTADLSSDPAEIENNLITQICGTVKWRQTMDKLYTLGITELVEIGSGRVLSGLAKKSNLGFTVSNISNIQEMEEFLAKI